MRKSVTATTENDIDTAWGRIEQPSCRRRAVGRKRRRRRRLRERQSFRIPPNKINAQIPSDAIRCENEFERKVSKTDFFFSSDIYENSLNGKTLKFIEPFAVLGKVFPVLKYLNLIFVTDLKVHLDCLKISSKSYLSHSKSLWMLLSSMCALI